MTDNLLNERRERPLYRVLDPAGFFGDDDHLYEYEDEIYFDGIPNEQMEPLNEVARQKLTTYLQQLDDLARRKAEIRNEPYIGRPKSIEGGIAVATREAREEMTIMGTRLKVSSIERAEPVEVPDTSNTARKRGRPTGSRNKPKVNVM